MPTRKKKDKTARTGRGDKGGGGKGEEGSEERITTRTKHMTGSPACIKTKAYLHDEAHCRLLSTRNEAVDAELQMWCVKSEYKDREETKRRNDTLSSHSLSDSSDFFFVLLDLCFAHTRDTTKIRASQLVSLSRSALSFSLSFFLLSWFEDFARSPGCASSLSSSSTVVRLILTT